MRACGRALFADLARRYLSGMANFEHPGPPPDWEDFRALGQHVAENGPKHVLKSTRFKALAATSGLLRESSFSGPVDFGCFFYLYLLADSRRFSGVVGIMEKVWELAVVDFKWIDTVGTLEMAFQDRKAAGKPDFSYRPFESFADVALFPPQLQAGLYMLVGRSTGVNALSDFLKRLLTAATDLIGAELLSALFFCIFRGKFCHSTVTAEMEFTRFRGLFENVLSVRKLL